MSDDTQFSTVPRITVEPEPLAAEDDKPLELHSTSQRPNTQFSGENKPPKHRKSGAMNAALSAVIGGVVGALLVVGIMFGLGKLEPRQILNSTGDPQNITINPSAQNPNLAESVAKKALPSVVSIYKQSPSESAIGSGVILDKEGNILTNFHVVQGAQTLSVNIGNNSLPAKVVGTDPSSDLAVVKADLGNLKVTPIEVGDSSKLRVGDWVMSIGSPYGLDQSVSAGIVSSLYRNTMLPSVAGRTIYSNLIQTDAAMNPGNSGGALVNDKGELVGINSIIQSASGSSAGVGFAIPSNYAIKIAKTILEGKQPVHAYMGASLYTITADVARANHLPVNQGAYVQSVEPDSPAAKAGLKSGDIIVKMDNQPINSADALILAVRSHDIGQTVNVEYVRGKDTKTTKITFGSDEALQSAKDKNGPLNDLQNFFTGRGNGVNGGK